MKKTVFFIIVLMLIPFLTCARATALENSPPKGNISFEENVIPYLQIHFVEEFFRFQWLDHCFDLKLLINCGEKNHSLKDFWELTDKVVKWKELKTKATERMYEFGYVIEDIPEAICEKVEYLVWKIEDCSFPLSAITFEQIEMISDIPYNITRIHLPNNLCLSYEDLSMYNYTVAHPSKLETKIGNVKGKTKWFLDPITYSDPTITITGYTSGSPCTFDDLYIADKSGFRILLTNQTAGNHTLTNQVKAADNKSITLEILANNVTVNEWCNITGTEKDDSIQRENLTITANTTYVTSEYWKSVTYINCSQNGNWNITVQQSQWGVVWRHKLTKPSGFSGTRYKCSYVIHRTLLVIGDGVTATWFADTEQQIIFTHLYNTKTINVKSNAHFRLGELVDATTKATWKGCEVITVGDPVHDTEVWYLLGRFLTVSGEVQLYSTNCFISTQYVQRDFPILSSGTVKIYNSAIDHTIWNTGFDVYNMIMSRSIYGIAYGTTGTFDKIFAYKNTYVIYNYASYTITVSNLVAKNNTVLCRMFDTTSSGNVYLTNPEADDWSFTWVGSNLGKLYRQYELDVCVYFDVNGSAVQNANVSIYDVNGKVGSWLTFANGTIPTQTITYGFYNQTGGNTIYSYAPFSLNITYGEYWEYNGNFDPHMPLHLDICVHDPKAIEYATYLMALILIASLISIVLYLGVKRKK